MIKMIATDLDGTLLCRDSSIHPITLGALQEADRRGIIIALCSGRPPHLIAGIAEMLGIETAIVALNGAIIYSKWGTKPLHTSFLPNEAKEKGLELCKELGLNCNLYGESRLERMNQLGPTTDLSTDFSDDLAVGERCYKMVGYSQDVEKVNRLHERWKEISGVELSKSWVTGLEMNAMGTNKGSGLALLCRHFGISPSEVMAFGDYDNDRTMFETAGYPVAMGNAIDSLKKLAWAETETNNEGGVGLALRRWVLK